MHNDYSKEKNVTKFTSFKPKQILRKRRKKRMTGLKLRP